MGLIDKTGKAVICSKHGDACVCPQALCSSALPRYPALNQKSLREHHHLLCFPTACKERADSYPRLPHGQAEIPASPTRVWRTWGTNSCSKVRVLSQRHNNTVKHVLESAFCLCYFPPHQFRFKIKKQLDKPNIVLQTPSRYTHHARPHHHHGSLGFSTPSSGKGAGPWPRRGCAASRLCLCGTGISKREGNGSSADVD